MNMIKDIFNVITVLMFLVFLLLLPVLWFAGGGAGAGKIENGAYYVADHRIYKQVNAIVYWYLFVMERCWLGLARPKSEFNRKSLASGMAGFENGGDAQYYSPAIRHSTHAIRIDHPRCR